MDQTTNKPTPKDLEEAGKLLRAFTMYDSADTKYVDGSYEVMVQAIASALRAREEEVKDARDRLWCEVSLSALKIDQVRDVMVLFGERRPQEELDGEHYWCNKCGYSGETGPEHPGCNYHASIMRGRKK